MPALTALRVSQDWVPNKTLLSVILACEQARVFILRAGAVDASARKPAAPIASTIALVAGPTAVIGNVIVSNAYQRRGLGRILMEHAIAWQRERGARVSFLNATVAGRPLYRKLGYRSAASYSWDAQAQVAAIDRAVLHERAHGTRARLSPAETLSHLAPLDHAAFGGDRIALLSALVAWPNVWLYSVADAPESPRAYAIARVQSSPHPILQVGPLVARDPSDAAALLQAIVADDAPWRASFTPAAQANVELRAVLPHVSDAAFALYAQCGLHIVRDDLIMRLDLRPSSTEVVDAAREAWSLAEHPEWMWAWLAPMVF